MTKYSRLAIIFFIILLCQSCTSVSRVIKYGNEDIYDYKIFPYTEINTGNNPFHFKQGNDTTLKNYPVKAMKRYEKDTIDLTLDDFLQTTGTISFLVIRNDSILFERYYKGHERSKISTIFSISKSITSLLVGIAVDEGCIGNISDTVTKYIPELRNKATEFQKLTIEDLLNMRSGFKFKEEYTNLVSAWKWAKFYYGKNQLKRISKLEFAHEPGAVHEYLSVSTALLGIILEKATGKEMGKYLEEKVWIPMGMEYKATWSLDDDKHRSSKSYSGLNTTAIDLAKIGRLYLKKGNWNGRQIVDTAWIEKSITPNPLNDGYQYQWYSFTSLLLNKDGTIYYPDSTSAENNAIKSGYKYHKAWKSTKQDNQWCLTIYPNDFYAVGIMQQTLFVDPKKNIIVVRLGEFFNLNVDYSTFIYRMIKSL